MSWRAATGVIAMVETRTLEEAESVNTLLEPITIEGVLPHVIDVDSLEGPIMRQHFGVHACEQQERREGEVNRRSLRLSILIVDEDPASLLSVQGLLGSRLADSHVDLAGSVEGALVCNEAREYQVVLTEMELAGLGGLGLMRAIHARRPHTSVLFMTSQANLLPVIIRGNAFGYVRKPIDAGYCIAAIRQAAQYHQRNAKISLLQNNIDSLQGERGSRRSGGGVPHRWT